MEENMSQKGTKRILAAVKDTKSSKTKKLCPEGTNGSFNHWSQGLKQTMQNPGNVVLETDLCSVIKDKYPKARKHFLVMAKDETVSSLKSLSCTHVSLLEHMIDVGNRLIKKEEKVNMEFKLGFHAVPSMALLHMHVISTDFDSMCLKTKRHWNSFTTDFFKPAEAVLSELNDKGSITIDSLYYNQFLKKSLKCHVCSIEPKNMPKLKDHIRTHCLEM